MMRVWYKPLCIPPYQFSPAEKAISRSPEWNDWQCRISMWRRQDDHRSNINVWLTSINDGRHTYTYDSRETMRK